MPAHWPEYLYEDADGYFAVDPKDRMLDAGVFDECESRVGRNSGPALLFDLHARGAIDISANPSVVALVWSGPEYPERCLEPAIWIRFFKLAGYTYNGQPAEPPTEPVGIYRGATYEGRFGMSWTTDIETARKFAFEGMRGRPRGAVCAATVEPAGLLAYIDEKRPGEAEFVVNPAYLSDDNVTQIEPA